MQTIIHVPHASTVIPTEVRNQFLLGDVDLNYEAIESADLYTDRLAKEAWPMAEIICAEVSRLVVDVERFPVDDDEIMAKHGRGMIYMSTHLGAPLRRQLFENEKSYLRERWYDVHWDRLRSTSQGGVLIDLHSYPRSPWKVEANPGSHRPEIDIGTDSSLTPSVWISHLKAHFEAIGFTVGQDTPYAGVIDAGSKYAVMLEIRRDILGSPDDEKKWRRMVEALSNMPIPATA